MTDLKYKLSKLKGKIVTIDGPAGSGKSTTAKLLAARMGYQYLDTGAMYRALTWFALQHSVLPSDGAKLKALAAALTIEFKTTDTSNRVIINGQDATDDIRTPEVSREVSEVSAHLGVREAMVAKQREIGQGGSIVAEGRDTGSVVFPHADVKFYMNASVQQRAQRRLIDLAKLGRDTTVEKLIEEINRRDHLDSTRQHSPLSRPQGAVTVDTTHMTINEQTDFMMSVILEKIK